MAPIISSTDFLLLHLHSEADLSKGHKSQPNLELDSTLADVVAKRMLPSLSALRAFEAAARYRNFTIAAQELNVTTSAISHQIRSLEEWLNIQLFVRDARPLRLTEAGTVYFNEVTGAFDRVSVATRQLTGGTVRTTLAVSTMHSFATNWLVPRLARFREMYEWLDVRVSTDGRFVDLRKENFDFAIRYGAGHWPGTSSVVLFDDVRLPVCSPALLKGGLDCFKLEEQTLIHDRSKPGWAEWFANQGPAPSTQPKRALYFDHTYLAILSAISGDGVAIVSRPLVADAMAAGLLVAPSAGSLCGNGVYFLVTAAKSENEEKVRIFRDWLLSECVTPLMEASGSSESACA